MGYVSFNSGKIAALGRETTSALNSGISTAKSKVSGSQVKLPQKIAEAELKLNDILSSLPQFLGELDRTTKAFERRIEMTAKNYQEREIRNTDQAAGRS